METELIVEAINTLALAVSLCGLGIIIMLSALLLKR